MLLLIGSNALNFHRSHANWKRPNDLDAIATYDVAAGFLKQRGCKAIYPINGGKTLFGQSRDCIYEIEIAWPDSTGAALLDLMDQDQYHNVEMDSYDGRAVVPSIGVLYALKMSHRYLRNSPHFHKTRRDILELRKMGAKIPDFLKDWYAAREKATYDYKLPNLNVDKQNFFMDQYQYDHDSLHEAVKIASQPAYTTFAEPGQQVKSSKKLWDKTHYSIQIMAGVEEASVLALERSLIPHPGKWSEDKAFEFALMKVCTSITSGWFRSFCYENHDIILDTYKARKKGLLQLLNEGLTSGIVKPMSYG